MKNLKITTAMKKSVNTYLIAEAYAQVMRKRVDEVETKLLKDWPLYVSDRFSERLGKERITEPKNVYLAMSKTDKLDNYFKERNRRLIAAGIKKTNDDTCPACIAENLAIQAKKLILETTCEMISENASIFDYHYDIREKFIETAIKAVVNSPNYERPNQ